MLGNLHLAAHSVPFDVAVIGGGIVGLATAYRIGLRRPLRLVVLEAESDLALHQTGNNSGVIHSGLYYKPGSWKARNCVEGRRELVRFCQEHAIPHDICGKIVVATHAGEIPALEELHRRGQANGLVGLRRLSPEEIREYEPHIVGVAGLHVPETGIADYRAFSRCLAESIRKRGGEVLTQARFRRCRRIGDDLVLETSQGEVLARNLVNCAGLQSDRVARACGVDPGVQIVPFRGEYYELVPSRRGLVRNLVYPVPDPRFPFLGVHFTRTISGMVEAGPNAVLALKREGYSWGDFSLRDMLQLASFGGFWTLARKFWRMGMGEMYRSLSKPAFVKALRKLMPDLRSEDIRPAGAGVRAQAVDAAGNLVDDFRIVPARNMIHVLNAPSPAATASLAIGRTIAELAEERFGPGRTKTTRSA